MLELLAQTSDPISGAASGWVGAGLLGSVLAWMFFVHLPAKDKQIREFVELAAKDRDQDRVMRHEVVEKFQAIVHDMHVEHQEDARADREAFADRQSRLEDAIKLQTAELKAAILGGGCRFVSSKV